ncbi:MAG: serine/threonine protein kinase, partial [Thermoplasmata archaeon]|nr:serine/threonine protein kinase [Thermoplasmata archaeon]
MKTKIIFAGVVLATQAFVTATDDWPQFRGPSAQGDVPDGSFPLKWGLDEGVAWKKEMPGKGWASPVISEGKVVLAASREKEGKVTLSVMAVDASSGEIRWDRELFSPAEKEATARHSKN